MTCVYIHHSIIHLVVNKNKIKKSERDEDFVKHQKHIPVGWALTLALVASDGLDD